MQALLLAHLLSDFAFQADWMIRAKRRGPRGVTPHIVVVAALTLLAVTPAFSQWWPAALAVILTHAVIDVGKISLDHRFPRYGLLLFYLDQTLHLLVLGSVTLLVGGHLAADPWDVPIGLWRLVLSYVVITFVVGILLRVSVPRLRFGNRWRGVLERTLYLTLPLLGWAVLAFGLLLVEAIWLGVWRERRVGVWMEVLLGSLIALAVGVLLHWQVG